MPQLYDPETGKRLITGYVPSTTLAVVGVAAYGVLAVIYWFRLWRQGRKWMLTLSISCTTMIVGFILRFPMQKSPDSLGLYIAQTMFILLSPCAFLAQDYIILPRLATWLGSEDCLFLPSRLVVRLFVWSDVITFWLQAAGGGMTAGAESMANIGHWIMIVGLAIQLLSFGTFTALAIVFGMRVRSRTPEKWSRSVVTKTSHGMTTSVRLGFWEDWRVLYFALLWTAIGIIVRSVFRICEFAQGYDGVLRTTEGYFYGLDALPLWIAIAVFAVIWPPTFLPEDHKPFADLSGGSYDMQRLNTESPTDVAQYYGHPSKA